MEFRTVFVFKKGTEKIGDLGKNDLKKNTMN